MEPRTEPKRRFRIEKLEGRIAPGILVGLGDGSFTAGTLGVSPPGAADGHTMDHLHPTVGVGGLNTAEARSGVVNWTPT